MLWVIGAAALLILLFVWLIVRGAANSIDDSTRKMLDEEQSQYIADYFRNKEEKK